ncbi:MAG: M1 family aminopeptidase [Gluconacetobacter sp.]
MLGRIARFEIRYQMRGPAFWVCALIFLTLTFLCTTVSVIQIGSGGNVHKNAPYAVAQMEQVFSVFSLFVCAAIAANAVIRDEETGFGQILYATRLRRLPYIFGRFLGVFVTCCLVFLAVPLGVFLGSFMPWVDPDTLGPVHGLANLKAYGLLAIPNLFLISAMMFAAATLTRSMMGSYIVAVLLMVVWTIAGTMIGKLPRLEETFGYLEPFGFGAVDLATRYWTAVERNTLAPPLTPMLLWNRVLWCGIAVGLLALAGSLFSFTRRQGRFARRRAEGPAEVPPVFDPRALPRPRFDARARRVQYVMRLRFEVRQVLRSPAYIVLLLLGIMNTVGGLVDLDEMYGTPVWPVTRVMIQHLVGAFTLIPFIMAAFYAGEVVWREQDRRMHELIGAAPLPGWIFVLSKVPAIAIVLFTTLLAGVAVGVVYQLAHGYTHLELGHYLLWFVLPGTVSVLLTAILAVFLQVLAPQKFVGWGLMFLYMVLRLIGGTLGLDDILYNYGRTPGMPLSDMNGVGTFWKGLVVSDLYWACCAIVLVVLCHGLWRRGAAMPLRARLAALPSRIRGVPAAIGGAALVCFAGLGAFIFVNTHIWNEYRTPNQRDRYMADYEKALLAYEHVPQPDVTALRFAIDIHPDGPAMTVSGHYVLTNHQAVPLDHVHVRMETRQTKLIDLKIDGATLERDYPKFHYRIYRLARPLAPGESIGLDFRTERGQRGFANSADTGLGIFPNGTFVNKDDFAPSIGMTRDGLLQDRVKRRKYGLVPELRMAKLEDRSAQAQNYIHAGWTTADITVTTDADQTPIAPGDRVSDVTHDGRRTAHFVTSAPVLDFFAVQSARYAERHALYDGPNGKVDLTVYYDPHHPWNVDRMLNGFKAGLKYYEPNFGPYQFHYARILEFPAYSAFAQAFAGTIPYSEGIGFIANLSNPDNIDYVTYVTAHELGHQWWAHQVVGADMQGATMLSETLAQYSALMTMRELYGPDKIRRFLKYELDRYLRARGTERLEEEPLERVENQQYIHYRKGSVVMYLLQDRLGVDRVNAGLRQLLADYRFKGAPWPRSLDLVGDFRAQAGQKEEGDAAGQQLITDLFEKITLYDLRTVSSTATKRADGRFDVELKVSAKKLYADGKGNETETPMNEPVDIGLFTAMPGEAAFDRKNVVLMQRAPIRTGENTLHFTVDRAPSFAGVDPYVEMVDRNPDDNVRAVTGP